MQNFKEDANTFSQNMSSLLLKIEFAFWTGRTSYVLASDWYMENETGYHETILGIVTTTAAPAVNLFF